MHEAELHADWTKLRADGRLWLPLHSPRLWRSGEQQGKLCAMGGRVEIDNEIVRVTRWTLGPSEDTGQHRHEFDYVVVPLTQGQMFVANTDGSSTTNDVTPGSPYFRHSGSEHTVSNSGRDVLDFVEIEVRT